ncbi:MAG: hypothetical protein IJT59_00355 [Desulfovibrionaceae bacterium]|nr:hypothetical protein [Desulfovibrionaceae bacterium]
MPQFLARHLHCLVACANWIVGSLAPPGSMAVGGPSQWPQKLILAIFGFFRGLLALQS